MESWIAALSQKFFEEQHAARLEAEAVAKKKNEARLAKKREAQALVKAVERRKVGRRCEGGDEGSKGDLRHTCFTPGTSHT